MRTGPFSKYLLCAAAAGAAGYLFGLQNAEPAPPAGNLAKVAASAREVRLGKPSPQRVQKRAARAWETAAAAINARAPLTTRLEQALRLDEPFSIAHAIQLLGEMSPEDAPAVFALLKAYPDWSPRPVWQAFWMSWGASDPEAALAAVDSGVPSYHLSDRAEKEIFLSLAEQDIERAARLAVTRAREASSMWGVEGTILHWAEKDLAAATQWALRDLEEPYQSWALKSVPFTLHSQQGAAAALRWWQDLPESGGVTSAFNTLVEISTQSSTVTPGERAALLSAGQARGVRSESLERRIASDFVRTDPLAGLQLFTSLPPAENGSYPAVGSLVREWALIDYTAAGNWLQSQTDKAWAADAIKAYAGAVRNADPDAADRWKSLLSDGTRK